ncbi:NADH dehydrogenase ubiquinone 1 alpha subcomplex subunit 9 mitochondrial [Taenia solium]|eukprot:TsM_000611700 transcript=TsM_000611700 gene=TsM_000611700
MALCRVGVVFANEVFGRVAIASSFSAQTLQQRSRGYASEPISLASLKRGTGGRSSFNGLIVTVFGASGYLGRHIVTHLGRVGAQVIIPYRGDPYFIRDLKVMGDLGQILFCPFHLEDEEAIKKSMRFSNVAINCMGKFNTTHNFTHEAVNVEGAARVARLSKEMGVERFVHISALSQSLNPERFVWKASEFRRTKALGEKAVLHERPDAIIFRPADIWGNSDRFLCYYASRERRWAYGTQMRVCLWKRGQKTVKQPVYVGDLARGIVNSLTIPDSPGKIYEAVGPHRYRLDDLVKWIIFNCRYLPRELNIGRIDPWFLTRVYLNEFVARINPAMCFERLEHDFTTDKLSGAPTLLDLNVKLTKLEDRLQQIVFIYRRLNNYWEAVGEFPEPPNPPISLV